MRKEKRRSRLASIRGGGETAGKSPRGLPPIKPEDRKDGSKGKVLEKRGEEVAKSEDCLQFREVQDSGVTSTGVQLQRIQTPSKKHNNLTVNLLLTL